LAKGHLRSQRDQLATALDGRVKAQHRLGLTALLGQLDSLAETMARFDPQSQEISPPDEAAIGLLETLPGVARPTAEMSVAAMGTARSRVPRAEPLASWAGVAPGHHESAGQRLSGKPRQGNRFLRTVLVQAAHAAARTKRTDLRAQYRRLATRRGQKRAMMAVAPSRLVMASDMIQRQEPYREAGGDFCDRLQPEDPARRLVKRREHLGSHVTLQNLPTEGMPSRQRLFSRQCKGGPDSVG
jgi:transposase